MLVPVVLSLVLRRLDEVRVAMRVASRFVSSGQRRHRDVTSRMRRCDSISRLAAKSQFPHAQVNEHWALQSDLCALHTLRYDFIGQFGRLLRMRPRSPPPLDGGRAASGARLRMGRQPERDPTAQHYTSRSLVSK